MIRSQLYKNIVLDLIFTLLTFGLFNIWVQYRQIKAINFMLGHKKYSFFKWLVFTLITFGLYHIYHEWRMSVDLAKHLGKDEGLEGVIAIILSVFALSVILDALQQDRINEYAKSQYN